MGNNKAKTNEQKLKESEEKYRTLIENAQEGIWTIDENSITSYVNPRMAEMLGYAQDETLGKHLFDFMEEKDIAISQRLIERRKQGIEEQHDFEFLRKNGTRIYTSLAAAPLMDEGGNYKGALAFVSDITERKQMELDLKSKQDSLESIFRAAPTGIGVVVDRVIKQVNDRFCELVGYAREELLNKSTRMVYPTDEDYELVGKEEYAQIDTSGFGTFETRFKRKDGKIIDILLSSALIDPEQPSAGVTFTALDITDRKIAEQKLKESEEKYRLISENANDLIAILNSKFEHEYINEKAYQKILGYSNEDILGKTRHDMIHPADTKQAFKVLKDGFKKGEGTGELRLQHKNGNYIWIETKGRTFKSSDGLLKAITVSRDITERKRSEQLLRETIEDLARINAELEQFTYIASHDLKEPLRMISNFAQLLEKRYKDKLDEDANDFIKFITEGVVRMQDLINSLLAYSRIGKNYKEFEKVDLNDVLKDTIDNLKQIINETNAEIIHDSLPSLFADKYQLIQVFQNLISNAIKFRGIDPPLVHISSRLDSKHWVFSIRDNGIGIKSKDFERIFVIFQRLHAKDEYDGTGIGLSICKKIVEQYGGKIWVDSEVGKGSTFYFSIPKKNRYKKLDK